MNTKTDEKLIDELLERGVEHIYPSKDLLKKELSSGKRLKLYCGFDPSGPSLHVGHAITINKLSAFQALGHEVIFLIGGFTGMIGDPTDKKATRKKLTKEDVAANSAHYVEQAKPYLDFDGANSATVLNNYDWQSKLSFADLIEVASNFTVGQMLVRDMFQVRIAEEKPIYLHEFLYPLAQAYDSLEMDVDLEVGGNDQLFNMMAGRDLMKAVKGKEKFVMTLKLLADENGTKMGKTEGNALFLDATAKEMFGQVMSWPDGFIAPAFELCTKKSWEEVLEIKKALESGVNPMESKLSLALEIVSLVHGSEAAQEAREYFRSTVQDKQIPSDIKSVSGATVMEAIVNYFGDSKSKSDIKRLFAQGAVSVNDVKVAVLDLSVKSGDVIQVGKREWMRVT